MSTFWIFVVFSFCFSQVLSIGLDHYSREALGEDSSNDDQQHEVQIDEDRFNRLRLYKIQNDHQELFDKNYIDPFNTLPSSCPRNSTANEIITIKVFGLEPFQVLCNTDIAGPGWTVIAARSNADLNFYRYWNDYKYGFGSLTKDFFIGLEKLHAITVSQAHELYVYLEDWDGNKRFAKYSEFLIGTETDKYKLAKLGTYVGNAGDSLGNYHVGMKFTTVDQKNNPGRICAIERMGAWWYENCCDSNLFGLYLKGSYSKDLQYKGMNWIAWRGNSYSYKVMRMMVKPKYLSN